MNDWNGFTFQVDNEKFFKGVLEFLKKKGKETIVEFIKKGYCTISQNGEWGKRYGASQVDIIFYVPFNIYDEAEKINKMFFLMCVN